jgi:hypothetical protein
MEEAVEFVRATGLVVWIDATGALISAVVALFVVRCAAPVLTFRWQKRALWLLLVVVACFFVARLLPLAERTLSLSSLGAPVPVAHVTIAMLLVICVGFIGCSLRRSERDELSSLRRSANTNDLTSLPSRPISAGGEAQVCSFSQEQYSLLLHSLGHRRLQALQRRGRP